VHTAVVRAGGAELDGDGAGRGSAGGFGQGDGDDGPLGAADERHAGVAGGRRGGPGRRERAAGRRRLVADGDGGLFEMAGGVQTWAVAPYCDGRKAHHRGHLDTESGDWVLHETGAADLFGWLGAVAGQACCMEINIIGLRSG
jgi:hypothetical protein